MGLLFAVEHLRTMRYGATHEGTIVATFDKGAANPVDGDYSKVQSLADLLVRPGRTKVAAVGLQ